jgi:hypothetical protein
MAAEQSGVTAPAVDGTQSVAAGGFLPAGEDLRRQAMSIAARSQHLVRATRRFLRECQSRFPCSHDADENRSRHLK